MHPLLNGIFSLGEHDPITYREIFNALKEDKTIVAFRDDITTRKNLVWELKNLVQFEDIKIDFIEFSYPIIIFKGDGDIDDFARIFNINKSFIKSVPSVDNLFLIDLTRYRDDSQDIKKLIQSKCEHAEIKTTQKGISVTMSRNDWYDFLEGE